MCCTVSFLGEGSPTIIDYRKKGTLILRSPLEDLATQQDDVRHYLKKAPHGLSGPGVLINSLIGFKGDWRAKYRYSLLELFGFGPF